MHKKKNDIIQAEIKAKITLIEDFISTIEERLKNSQDAMEEKESVLRLESTIERLSIELSETKEERTRLRIKRQSLLSEHRRADSQIIAINEMLTRYNLLNDLYASDLKRLDFISEGSHYFGSLQSSDCPFCGLPMTRGKETLSDSNDITTSIGISTVYEAARAEASKIQGLKNDLQLAIGDLKERRSLRMSEKSAAASQLLEIDLHIDNQLAPLQAITKTSLDDLVQKRLALHSANSDREEAARLHSLLIEQQNQLPASTGKQKWAPLNSIATRDLCVEIERVLKEWSWEEDVRVEFDEKHYDIKINGKPRRSHGKGYRAVYNAAYLIGLLRYCHTKGIPHPGFVVLDTPLNAMKQRKGSKQEHIDRKDDIDPRIEPSFWRSLAKLDLNMQVIIFENKEPDESLKEQLNVQLFAGETASAEERIGFIPV